MYTLNDQVNLFNECFEKNEVWKANILIKNIFNRNIDDQEVFQRFFDFNIKVANWNIDLPTRKLFLEQASSAIVFFSESVSLTEELLDYIQLCQNKVDVLGEELFKVEQLQYNRKIEEEQHFQTELLRQLTEYKYGIFKSNSEEQFQDLLRKVQVAEAQVVESILNEKELKLFEELTKEYSKIIGKKIEYFERNKAVAYNKRAVNDFQYAFTEFKQSEEKYKLNWFDLRRLVRNRLFGYDSTQLVNETLIYYNHVYSYIFGSLDEEGKYKLTDLAIEMENK